MRRSQSLKPWWAILLITFFASSVTAHTVITYPGWRGNNLHSTGNMSSLQGMAIARSPNNESELLYPLGMQWAYPCGGMPVTQNRTKWPVKGGAIAFQPGWFPGHKTAFIYMNMGFGTIAPNMSHPMIAPFQLIGPTKEEYPGTFCLRQVAPPAGFEYNVGDNVTIQIIETAIHGAALYNCVDVTLAEPGDVEEVTRENCFNSSELSARYIFAMDISNAASIVSSPRMSLVVVPLLLAGSFALLF
ncbi:hypothetical protein PAAG_04085 [Paracoccidioides lutzii Pb01]|uniref:Copper acquisition factor BIM1-like domain-containing protein n=1 Tax=Paracoccidioides lutzii (strain ATCC MYA-826 / Pb01) TaxID=502779 RepID=C1GZZ1_PARBA|nr:hypothetical protein PAAG_04085 [Paracoccidioides lutzii Pb01]EEH33032.1 hypothetical protein PAAG_04085 [Paracoccidioides lutzii Pb01]